MGRRRRRDGREVDLGSPDRLAQRRAGPVLPMRFETGTNLTAMSAAPTPSRRIPAPDFAAWLGVAPFFVFAAMFLIAPTAALLVGAFQDHEGAFTLGNIMRLNQPSIRLSYWLSLQVSAASAALGALLGLALALAALKGGLPLWLRPTLMTFSGVASNFAGVPLAFAFMATLGRLGLVTVLLRNVGARSLRPRLQHPDLLGPHHHLSLFPDPADGAGRDACDRRIEVRMGGGGGNARREFLAILAPDRAADPVAERHWAPPCCSSPTPSAPSRRPTR